jgi:hypothetical protein
MNEEIIKLIKVLTSAGFKTLKVDFFYGIGVYHKDIKLLVYLPSERYDPLPKENFIQLIEILDSLRLGIVDFNSLYKNGLLYFKLILHYLPKKTNL